MLDIIICFASPFAGALVGVLFGEWVKLRIAGKKTIVINKPCSPCDCGCECCGQGCFCSSLGKCCETCKACRGCGLAKSCCQCYVVHGDPCPCCPDHKCCEGCKCEACLPS